MGLSVAVIDALVASGCTVEQLAAAMKADLAEQDQAKAEKRAKDAERQRKSRLNRGLSRDVTVTTCDERDPLDKKAPQTPKKINPKDPPIVPPRKGPIPAKPEDVSEQVWADWLALRKSKRAPVTPGVIDGARREAAKLGWTLDRTLAEWVFRGSQGFQAEWITPARPPPVEPISLVDHILKQKAAAP